MHQGKKCELVTNTLKNNKIPLVIKIWETNKKTKHIRRWKKIDLYNSQKWHTCMHLPYT
jgi:hypothetical protein